MNGEGIMGLPAGAAMQQQNPLDAPETEASFEQVRQNVSPKEFGNELLYTMSEVDPEAVRQLQMELDSVELPAQAWQALEDLVQYILENPGEYNEIREDVVGGGLPEEFLPETFNLEYLSMLKVALDQMTPETGMREPVQMAQGGLASLEMPPMAPVAQSLQQMGRNGDTMLAHITPQEATMLKRMGGSGTINPYTGLPEFNLLKKAWKAVTGAVKGVVEGVTGVVKSIANVVKKVLESPVGKIAATIAAVYFLGPQGLNLAAGKLGITNAAMAMGVNSFVGSTAVNLASGMRPKEALQQGLVAGVLTGVGTGLTSEGGFGARAPGIPETGIEGFGAASDTLSGPYPTSAGPIPDAQAMASGRGGPFTTFGDFGEEIAVREGPLSVARAPVQTPLAPATTPLDISREAEGFSPYRGTPPPYEAVPTLKDAQQQAQAIQQARAAAATGTTPSTSTSLGSPGILDRAKAFYQNPSFDSFSDVFIDPNARTFLGKYGPLAVAGLGATAAMGGFKAPPTDETPLDFDPVTGLRPGELPFEQRRPDLFGPERRLSPADFTLGQTLVESPRYSTPVPSGVPVYMPPNMMTFQPGGVQQPYNRSGLYGIPAIYTAKKGSSPEGVTNFPRKTGPINGPGTGTSDSIPAMLSDGEFVFTAKAVRNIGNGSRRKGAARMYKMMKMLEGGPVGAAAKRG
jgi:hypothetical protein